MNSNLLEVALSYAEKGFYVFPCKPRSKEPATSHGFKDATIDEDQVRQWWLENPEYNIGIPTGAINGFWVLDVDGEQGSKSLNQFRSGIPLDTPQILTGKGYHLYFKYSEGMRNSAGSVAQGLDVRAEGGYVLAPGSVHKNGTTYDYTNDYREPTDAPEKLLRAVTQRSGGITAPVEDAIEDGSRNSTLFSRGRSLFKQGYNETEVFSTLNAVNQNRCEPPIDDDELEQIVRSAANYERGELYVERSSSDLLPGRVLLADPIENGVPEPDVFEPGILLEGLTHHLFAKRDYAKTWFALWLSGQAIRRKQRVLYLDMENGQRIISDRFRAMGIDTTEVDELLHYYYAPPLDMRQETLKAYVQMLDVFKPDLIIFDSWINFIAKAGLNENENTDIAKWSIAFSASRTTAGNYGSGTRPRTARRRPPERCQQEG